MQGAWVLQLDPRISGASATDPKAYEAFNAVPSGGDWVDPTTLSPGAIDGLYRPPLHA
jgi:hypothetical protein